MAATGAEEVNLTASEVLRHPIRVRILEALNVREMMSPAQFASENLGRGLPGLKKKSQQATLSHVSYHFRILAEAGSIEEVCRRQVRGAVEHFYRARSRAFFSDEDWAKLDEQERREISKVVLQSLIAQAEGAMLSETFDSRQDRWLAWIPLKLDEHGWSELHDSLERCYREVERIQDDAKGRLDRSGEDSIAATFGVMGFESPPVTGPRTQKSPHPDPETDRSGGS
jgi:hypothetical protein